MTTASNLSDDEYLKRLKNTLDGTSAEHLGVYVEDVQRLMHLANAEGENVESTTHTGSPVLPVGIARSLVQRAAKYTNVDLGPDRTLVELWDLEDFLALIVPKKTGVLWTNQTGGTACAHPVLEGIFLGLGRFWEAKDPVADYWHSGSADPAFLARLNVRMQQLLEAVEFHHWLRLSDKKPEAYGEAWIPVRVVTQEEMPEGNQPPMPLILQPFLGQEAILTYPNSD